MIFVFQRALRRLLVMDGGIPLLLKYTFYETQAEIERYSIQNVTIPPNPEYYIIVDPRVGQYS
jgi:hypothetical protein